VFGFLARREPSGQRVAEIPQLGHGVFWVTDKPPVISSASPFRPMVRKSLSRSALQRGTSKRGERSRWEG
jgi:hypothetical protein